MIIMCICTFFKFIISRYFYKWSSQTRSQRNNFPILYKVLTELPCREKFKIRHTEGMGRLGGESIEEKTQNLCVGRG